MGETRTRLFMQMKLMACRDDFDCLIRYYHCAINNYPEYYCPPMPLPVSFDCTNSWGERAEMAEKDILPPTLKMILKTHYPLPVKQPSPTSPPSNTPPFPSPLPSAE